MLKGAIFDADGTLLDSMPLWHNLGERYLARHHIKAEPGLSAILYPMTLEESSGYLKTAYHLPNSPQAITAELLDLIRGFYLCEVQPKPGVCEYIRQLTRRGIPMIVATSNDKALLQGTFARLQIDDCFQDILTCSELNVSKREAAIYLKAAQVIGTLPQNTAVFEDVLHGIQAAKSAGFITVAMDDASNRAETDQLFSTANCFIRNFTDPILKTL